MLEVRSSLAAAAVTAAVGLSIAVATPAVAATGAQGIKGADGGALLVRDAAGNRIGRYAGALGLPVPFPVVQVLGDDGGIYMYLESGQLMPSQILGSGIEPMFLDAACAGPAFLTGSGGSAGMITLFAGGTARIVIRTITGPSINDLGPARVWKFTSNVSTLPVAPPAVYELNSSGVCSALAPGDLPAAGDLRIDLQQIPAPADGVGRLTIS